jgi:hypothetical protein
MSAEPGRRSLLVMMAAFGALTVAVVATSLVARVVRNGGTSAPSSSSSSAAPQMPLDVRAFLGPLADGDRFETWHIVRVDASQRGLLTLEIADDAGVSFAVDLRARAPGAPEGIVETTDLAIYTRSDHGSHTPEAVEQGCRALGEALRAREAAGHAPPALESLGPRADSHDAP